MARSGKTRVNEYLYHEFGVTGGEGAVDENWPFALHYLGETTTPDGPADVYGFENGGEGYFVVDGPILDAFRSAGMTLADLELAAWGERWIADRGPVDLSESRPSDSLVPPAVERRAALQRLVSQAVAGGESLQLLEGLYLRSDGSYVALAKDPLSNDAVMVGTNLPIVRVGFPDAPPHRRLALAVGRFVRADRGARP